MPDYKEMYLAMVRASEKALRQMDAAREELIRAQQYCEELYLSDGEEGGGEALDFSLVE